MREPTEGNNIPDAPRGSFKAQSSKPCHNPPRHFLSVEVQGGKLFREVHVLPRLGITRGAKFVD